MIRIGFEVGKGKSVEIEETHTFIGGTTGTGKSELLRALIDRTEAKILVLDVKRPRDYVGYGVDIPLYIQQRMEAMTLKDLLESTERISIKRELPELSRLCRKSKTWEELLELARERQDDPKTRDFYKDVLEVLIVLFERLVEEFNRYQFADKVELPNKVNVMDLSTLSDQLQQVVVSSVLRYILTHNKNVILVIDEAHRFVPQAQASAARHDVVRVIREGRANRIFVWLADQTVTGIDKQLMKQMQVWCLARQMELNEAERTLKQIPQRKSLGLTVEAIQTLGLGEFIIVTPKWATRTYVQPVWVSDEEAVAVAKGELEAETLTKPQEEEVDEDMKYKELAEKLETELEKAHTRNMDQEKLIEKLQVKIRELEKTLDKIQKEKASTPKNEPPKEYPVEDIPEEEAPSTWPIDFPGEPASTELPDDLSTAKLILLVDQRVNQLMVKERRVVQVPVDSAVQEAIMSSWMNKLTELFASLGEPAKRAARFIYSKGEVPHKDLYYHIRHRHGSTDASFSRDYINPLTKLNIIERSGKGGSVRYRWAVDDKIIAQFKDILTPEQLKEVKDFVHSLIL